MDWNAAIEKHREALKGIVAALVAMVESAARAGPSFRVAAATRRQRCHAISTAPC